MFIKTVSGFRSFHQAPRIAQWDFFLLRILLGNGPPEITTSLGTAPCSLPTHPLTCTPFYLDPFVHSGVVIVVATVSLQIKRIWVNSKKIPTSSVGLGAQLNCGSSGQSPRVVAWVEALLKRSVLLC